MLEKHGLCLPLQLKDGRKGEGGKKFRKVFAGGWSEIFILMGGNFVGGLRDFEVKIKVS